MSSRVNQPKVIAIDGPAASGKTTIGRKLAEKLHYVMLDTGVMYRAVTLGAIVAGIAIADENGVSTYARQMTLDINPPLQEDDGRAYSVLINGIDLTWQLRSKLVDHNVSEVSAYPAVRTEMVERQRRFGERGGVVMIGRDIGTVVLPNAPLKLFMVASAEVRAQRRFDENKKRDDSASFEHILAEIKRRDQIDSNREIAPMVAAADAHIIDTDNRTVDQILGDILALL